MGRIMINGIEPVPATPEERQARVVGKLSIQKWRIGIHYKPVYTVKFGNYAIEMDRQEIQYTLTAEDARILNDAEWQSKGGRPDFEYKEGDQSVSFLAREEAEDAAVKHFSDRYPNGHLISGGNDANPGNVVYGELKDGLNKIWEKHRILFEHRFGCWDIIEGKEEEAEALRDRWETMLANYQKKDPLQHVHQRESEG